MNRSTMWVVLGALLLLLVSCSKDDSTSVGPVTTTQEQQKKVAAPPISYWPESDIAEWATAEPYIKTYPSPAKKDRLGKTLASPPIVTNGGFEDGFGGWTTVVSGSPGFHGIIDWRTSPPTAHPEWAWIVGASDPFGSNTTIYNTGMLHPEPLAHSGVAGASAVENWPTGHQLYQLITLPAFGQLTLEFWIRWKNQGYPRPGYPLWVHKGQDIIVSLIDPSTGAILDTLFKASTLKVAQFSGGGNITTANYEKRTADINAFAGRTVRLNFEINGNAYPLFVDLDDIAIIHTVTNQPPVANAGLNQTINCAGPSGVTVNLDGTGSSDPDVGDVLTYTWTGPFGTATGATPTVTLGPGVHTVTLTVDDGKGGTASDDVIITVNEDKTAPTITLNGSNPMTLECPGPYTELGAVVSDDCDLSLAPSITGTVNVRTVGTYIIEYTATDLAGNTSEKLTRTVYMVDTTPPTIALLGPSEITLECPAVYAEPGWEATDNCDPPPTVAVAGTVDIQTPGTYTLTYTATDANGLSSTATRVVRVVDTTPPSIMLNGPNPMTLECPTPYIEPGAIVSDGCSATPSLSITGSVDAHTLGMYTITYKVTDGSGNTTTAERTVNVVDTTPPTIVLNGANPMRLEVPATYSEPGAMVTDACDPSPTLTIEGSVNGNALGTYTLTYTASDHSGNTATVTRTVIVEDTKAPMLSCYVSTSSLWPPKHDLVNVGFGVYVSDAGDSNPSISVKVYSDEEEDVETGDGNYSPDAKGIGVGTLRLRAERNGAGDGRVYLIVVTATDESGNSSFHYCTVVVPHSQSKAAVNAVNAQAAAARTSCGPNGSPLTPYLLGGGPVIGPKQ